MATHHKLAARYVTNLAHGALDSTLGETQDLLNEARDLKAAFARPEADFARLKKDLDLLLWSLMAWKHSFKEEMRSLVTTSPHTNEVITHIISAQEELPKFMGDFVDRNGEITKPLPDDDNLNVPLLARRLIEKFMEYDPELWEDCDPIKAEIAFNNNVAEENLELPSEARSIIDSYLKLKKAIDDKKQSVPDFKHCVDRIIQDEEDTLRDVVIYSLACAMVFQHHECHGTMFGVPTPRSQAPEKDVSSVQVNQQKAARNPESAIPDMRNEARARLQAESANNIFTNAAEDALPEDPALDRALRKEAEAMARRAEEIEPTLTSTASPSFAPFEGDNLDGNAAIDIKDLSLSDLQGLLNVKLTVGDVLTVVDAGKGKVGLKRIDIGKDSEGQDRSEAGDTKSEASKAGYKHAK